LPAALYKLNNSNSDLFNSPSLTPHPCGYYIALM